MNVSNRHFDYLCNIYEYYEEKFIAFVKSYLGETDPRTSQWRSTRSPIPLLFVLILYYTTALFGPRFMKTRKHLQLRKLLMVYNVCQICLSSFIMKEIIVASCEVGFSLTCQPVDVSMNPSAVRMASSSWWYHISKYVDLLDTVFFVLRKKEQQMTFLHLFHHSTMLVNSYLGMLYIPGGQAIVSTFLNSFVHVIMYWYYLISAVGPRFHKYLWWKKYLTILQLTQFFTVLAHVFLGSISGCQVPDWLKFYVTCYVSVLIILFTNFYLLSYQKMSLLKALGCVCFQNQMSKSELENKTAYQEEPKREMTDDRKLIELAKKEAMKAKSPFTVVNRNSIKDFSGGSSGDSLFYKNKNI